MTNKVHNGTYYNTTDLQVLMDVLDGEISSLDSIIPSVSSIRLKHDVLVHFNMGSSQIDVVTGDGGELKLGLPNREHIFQNDLEALASTGDFIPQRRVGEIVELILHYQIIRVSYSDRALIRSQAVKAGFMEDVKDAYHLPGFVKAVVARVSAHGLNVGINKKSKREDRVSAQMFRLKSKWTAEKAKRDYHGNKVGEHRRMVEHHEGKTTQQDEKLRKIEEEMMELSKELK